MSSTSRSSSVARASAGARGLACAIVLLVLGASTMHARAAAADTQAEPSFDVWEIQVAGNRLLDDRMVERVVYGFLGPGKGMADIERARAALETLYHDAGYGTVSVNIPEQDVDEGVVRLEVLEGKVAQLWVTGSRYFSLGRIRAAVPSLARGATPNLGEVQRELARLNRASPDRAITPALAPGRRPGDVEVELKVKDHLPLHGGVALNDQYSRDTSRTRLTTSLRYDNLWQREHSFGVSWQTTPEDPSEVEVVSGTYLFHPGDDDALLALYAVKSDSDVLTLGATGTGVGVLGRGVITGARYIQPLRAGDGSSHNLTLGLDYKDFEDTVAPAGQSGFATPISYSKLVAGYGAAKYWDTRELHLNLELDFGLRGLGNTVKEFENKRFQAKPNYAFLRLDSRFEQTLPHAATAVIAVAGQVASGPIISNEQFSLGGASSVRGYVETQVLADDALQGRLELRSPALPGSGTRAWLPLTRVFVFGEGGYGRLHQPLPGQAADAMLASAGLGLSLSSTLGIESTIAWATPFIRNGDIRPGESRFHFDFDYEF